MNKASSYLLRVEVQRCLSDGVIREKLLADKNPFIIDTFLV